MRAPLFIHWLVFVSFSLISAASADNLPKRYYDIKRVGTELATKGQALMPGDTTDNLWICENWSDADQLGTQAFSAPQDTRFLDVAGAIVRWRLSLMKWQPNAVWQARLSQAEDSLVAIARSSKGSMEESIKKEGRVLVRDMNKLKVGRQLSYNSECGAGGFVDVKFRTEPSGGRVSIISEFDYELCKLQNTQNDHAKCSAWRVAKDPELVSGSYYLQVNWPNRVEGPDRYDLNPQSGKLHDVYWLRFK